MHVTRQNRRARSLAAPLLAAGFALATTSCGGGGSGGAGSGHSLNGLILVNFLQSGQDNVPLNRVLEFRFSGPVDPASVDPSSIQIREGPSFGAAVFGKYIIEADRVFFEPRLPGLCDLSDSGLHPNTDYRVLVLGAPEGPSVRSLSGAPLQASAASSFHTRLDTDPALFEDQAPGVLPTVVSTSPGDGAAGVAVGTAQANVVKITFSENLAPCTVNADTVVFQQYATGGPTGFFPSSDQTPGDPFTWGSGLATVPPRRIRVTYDLQQDFLSTVLTLTPTFGEFPDNALLVVQLTNQVRDLGGNPLVPLTFAFTTEDRPPQTKSLAWTFDGDVSFDANLTTAEVNTARAPSRVGAYLLISGDGDNGPNPLLPAGPDTSRGPLGCTSAGFQANDGNPDDFDPLVDTLLSTGATVNTCKNSTDGSTAVVFEYRTFRIRSGVTVRLSGVNAAIILVRGDISIDAGGRLLARGDGIGGAPNSAGTNGIQGSLSTTPAGGLGVAGGGPGGFANNDNGSGATIYGGNGTPGVGSPDAFTSPGLGGAASPTLIGAGRGAVGTFLLSSNNPGASRIAPGGGGGGHAAIGLPGSNTGTDGGVTALMNAFADGAGGGTYGDPSQKMPTAEAGSGGGGGGLASSASFFTGNTTFQGTGGAGGAGGGFIDLTTTADIRIFGTIDAAGSRGGTGVARNGAFFGGGGGGGGGSGGGIRLLTPAHIVLGSGAVLTAAGGSGGGSIAFPGGGATANPGGNGGVGRLVLEDGDSVIAGLPGATVTPGEGAPAGFYRGVFDATRFQGGGIRPVAVSNLIDAGPFSPTYLTADQQYVPSVPAPGTPRQDFVAGVPPASRNPNGTHTAIFVEVQGYLSDADGTPNLASATGWKSVGYFRDSGSELFPIWTPNAQPPVGDVAYANGILPGNTGNGIAQINGREFLQLRITFYLAPTIGVFDAGPYLDRWTLNLQYDQ